MFGKAIHIDRVCQSLKTQQDFSGFSIPEEKIS
jgi:hypothetical protein